MKYLHHMHDIKQMFLSKSEHREAIFLFILLTLT